MYCVRWPDQHTHNEENVLLCNECSMNVHCTRCPTDQDTIKCLYSTHFVLALLLKPFKKTPTEKPNEFIHLTESITLNCICSYVALYLQNKAWTEFLAEEIIYMHVIYIVPSHIFTKIYAYYTYCIYRVHRVLHIWQVVRLKYLPVRGRLYIIH